MKKIYMILSAALISGGVFGQISKPKAQLSKASDARIAPAVELNQNTDRAIIWSNTFDDPSDWTLGDSGPVGLNFSIGTGLESTGEAPIATIESDTYDDGVAMVDSDAFANQTGIENCWFETAQPIDCTDHPYVHIEFANQYWMWDSGTSDGNEYCLLEVSVDGTWPDVDTYEVEDAMPGQRFELWPDMATQDYVANPTIVRFDISELAGNAPEVWLRWRWVGTFGYSWFVDDVVVFDGFSNDLGVQGQAFANASSYTNVNGSRFVPVEFDGEEVLTGLEYFKYPESQRPEIMAYTPIINWGDTDMNEVILKGDFNGEQQTADPVAIAAGEAVDSVAVLSWATDAIPSGDYDFTLTVEGENVDEDPSNNTAIAPLEMTDYTYSRDDGLIRGALPNTATLGIGYSAGCLYEVFEDATVYAVEFAVTTNTVPQQEVQVELRDASTENFDPLSESDELAIWSGSLNSFDNEGDDIIWITLTLDPPVDVSAGDLLLPTMTYFGGDGVQIAEGQTDAPDQTAFIFGDFGDAGVDWYFTNDLPMVRLSFDPGAADSVEELTEASAFGLGQNMPNPATGTTLINYELFQAGAVTFEVFDITGKKVFASYEGVRGTGNYFIELDTDELNSGIYTYTLTVGEEQLTKKMIVE